jgi:hypothetical protein
MDGYKQIVNKPERNRKSSSFFQAAIMDFSKTAVFLSDSVSSQKFFPVFQSGLREKYRKLSQKGRE